MERVYIALTRHMATRRTPAPEDNHEEVQDRFRFKMFLMAFVEDLIYDWHPWATRQVKGTRKPHPFLFHLPILWTLLHLSMFLLPAGKDNVDY